MKYILTIFLALMLASCESSPSPDDIIISNTGGISMQAYKFSYEDHDYIYFKHEHGQIGTAGVVHDPACSCHER